MIERIQYPYEFLVRWMDGVISGAHVGFIECLVEEGKILQRTPCPVQVVAIAGSTGFPLEQVLETLHSTALITAEKAVNELAQANLEVSRQKEEIAALQRKIAELTSKDTK